MTNDEVVALLKDLASEVGAVKLTATLKRERDVWTTIEVRHAGLFSESQDGWDVMIKEGGL